MTYKEPQLSGDITGSIDATSIASISGASPINITPANLQWLANTTGPTILQANTTTTSTPQNITIQSQQASNAGVIGVGHIILQPQSTNSGGGQLGYVKINYGATTQWQAGVRVGNTGLAAIYALPGTNAPSSSNFIIQCDGSSTWLNSPTASGTNLMVDGTTELAITSSSVALTPTNLNFTVSPANLQVAGTTQMSVTSSIVTITPPTIQWGSAVTAPTISQANIATTSTPQNIVIQSQQATNAGVTGVGHIILQPQSGNGGGGQQGYVKINYGATTQWQAGTRVGNTAIAAIYALPGTNAPSSSNFIIQCDGSSTWLNSPTTSGTNIMVNGTTQIAVTSTAITLQQPLTLTNQNTAITATAGTNGALPALVLGYLSIPINGTTVKIPYYSV